MGRLVLHCRFFRKRSEMIFIVERHLVLVLGSFAQGLIGFGEQEMRNFVSRVKLDRGAQVSYGLLRLLQMNQGACQGDPSLLETRRDVDGSREVPYCLLRSAALAINLTKLVLSAGVSRV